MANLTLTIDDEVLRRARIRALEEGTSVNAMVRQYLEGIAGSDERAVAMARFVERGRSTGSGSDGSRTWTRDEIYTDRVAR